MEIVVYLSVVLLALLISLEEALSAEQEVLLIWGTSIGLTFAHLFAFRLSEVYDVGLPIRAGWRVIGAMFVAAAGLATVSTIPYLLPLERFEASSVTSVLLVVAVAASAYLAARNRGATRWQRIGYASIGVVLGVLFALVKHYLTH